MSQVELLSGTKDFFNACDRLADIERQSPVLSTAELFVRSGVDLVVGWEKWRGSAVYFSMGQYMARQKELALGLSAVTIGTAVKHLTRGITSGQFDAAAFVEEMGFRLKDTKWGIENPEWFKNLGVENIDRQRLLLMAQEADVDPTLVSHMKNKRLLPQTFNRVLDETNIGKVLTPALDVYSDLAWQVSYPRTTEYVDKDEQRMFLDAIDNLIWNLEDRADDDAYKLYMRSLHEGENIQAVGRLAPVSRDFAA